MEILGDISSSDKVLLVWSDLGNDADKLQSSVNSMKVGFILVLIYCCLSFDVILILSVFSIKDTTEECEKLFLEKG